MKQGYLYQIDSFRQTAEQKRLVERRQAVKKQELEASRQAVQVPQRIRRTVTSGFQDITAGHGTVKHHAHPVHAQPVVKVAPAPAPKVHKASLHKGAQLDMMRVHGTMKPQMVKKPVVQAMPVVQKTQPNVTPVVVEKDDIASRMLMELALHTAIQETTQDTVSVAPKLDEHTNISYNLKRNISLLAQRIANLRSAAALGVIALVTVAGYNIVQHNQQYDQALAESKYPVAAATAEAASYSAAPQDVKKLSIPALGIDARVVESNNKDLSVPTIPADPGTASWNSATSFDKGPLTITGHTKAAGGDAIFANLYKLQNGAKITVEQGNGKKTEYAVKGIKSIKVDQKLSSQGSIANQALRLVAVTGKDGKLADRLEILADRQ